MKGCKRGVQERLLELNPKSFYVPCGCHSLNLILGDMAKSSVVATTLFGVLHQIYLLFGASTQRWKILKTHVKNLTVKPISDTRWECRIDSVKAVRYQTAAVYDALVEVSENAKRSKSKDRSNWIGETTKNFSVFGYFSHLVRFIVSNEYDQQSLWIIHNLFETLLPSKHENLIFVEGL